MSATFTTAEREQIRRYLGYPLQAQAIANIISRCSVVEGFGLDAMETVRGLLRELSRLDQQIKNVTPFSAQTFSSSAAGTRQSPPNLQLQTFKDEARRLIAELSETISLNVCRDIYGLQGGQARTIR